jgi:hypothetical protein
MFKLKEGLHILVAVIIFAFIASFLASLQFFLLCLLFSFIAISVNVIAKKITAYYLDCYTEESIWSWQQFGFRKHHRFNFPLPAGIIFPLLFSLASAGFLKFLALLQFDITPATHRVAKRHGFYSWSELTESHIAIVASAGIFFNLVLSTLAYLIGQDELARLSIYFAFSNIIPISSLDGGKVLFGNKVLWTVLAVLCTIALLMTLVIR